MSFPLAPQGGLGLLGGGQLGRLLLLKAYEWDLPIGVLDGNPVCPCASLGQPFQTGGLKDYDSVVEFGQDYGIIIYEFEHINVSALEQLIAMGVNVAPSPQILALVQDKGKQKSFYREKGYPTNDFAFLASGLDASVEKGETKYLKTRRQGYDGYGVTKVEANSHIDKNFDVPCILEDAVSIDQEFSVIVARNARGEIKQYPPVRMVFDEDRNVLKYLAAPANIENAVLQEIQTLAYDLAEDLGLEGILAIEVFLNQKGHILINEIAPRPHNSGHQTMQGNATSQYEQMLRAVLNLPLGSVNQLTPVVLINLLGEGERRGSAQYHNLDLVFGTENAELVLYGKQEVRPGRKMAHICLTGEDLALLEKKAEELAQKVKVTA